jgi:pimeloyl-ACP methyl ester carboxylesterase
VYDEMRLLGPAPDVVHEVPTEFGTVRAYQHGPACGKPIVLVHCFYASSAMWAGQVPALVGDFTVYTIDCLASRVQAGNRKRCVLPVTASGVSTASSPGWTCAMCT